MISVLLDTSFFIRLLNPEDQLHNNAKSYYRYFLENDIKIKISTISIAEYCVGGDITDLPLRNMMILPFNCDHGQKAGLFARTVFEVKKRGNIQFSQRPIIPNDSKLFAQADVEDSVDAYVTADVESSKIYAILKEHCNARFDFIDINTPANQRFGILF